uniref:Uncharacterized protein n=1 Tax=Sicyonia whispovirus TaxID=2984283 RepID=A0A9C7F8H0_9VIRU|nr:MAG: hypothetical protein [Sicyonia whispovirus]
MDYDCTTSWADLAPPDAPSDSTSACVTPTPTIATTRSSNTDYLDYSASPAAPSESSKKNLTRKEKRRERTPARMKESMTNFERDCDEDRRQRRVFSRNISGEGSRNNNSGDLDLLSGPYLSFSMMSGDSGRHMCRCDRLARTLFAQVFNTAFITMRHRSMATDQLRSILGDDRAVELFMESAENLILSYEASMVSRRADAGGHNRGRSEHWAPHGVAARLATHPGGTARSAARPRLQASMAREFKLYLRDSGLLEGRGRGGGGRGDALPLEADGGEPDASGSRKKKRCKTQVTFRCPPSPVPTSRADQARGDGRIAFDRHRGYPGRPRPSSSSGVMHFLEGGGRGHDPVLESEQEGSLQFDMDCMGEDQWGRRKSDKNWHQDGGNTPGPAVSRSPEHLGAKSEVGSAGRDGNDRDGWFCSAAAGSDDFAYFPVARSRGRVHFQGEEEEDMDCEWDATEVPPYNRGVDREAHAEPERATGTSGTAALRGGSSVYSSPKKRINCATVAGTESGSVAVPGPSGHSVRHSFLPGTSKKILTSSAWRSSVLLPEPSHSKTWLPQSLAYLAHLPASLYSAAKQPRKAQTVVGPFDSSQITRTSAAHNTTKILRGILKMATATKRHSH